VSGLTAQPPGGKKGACMYAHVCACVNVCTCVRACVCACVCMCVHVCACVCICLHVRTFVCMRACVYTHFLERGEGVLMHTHTPALTSKYICTHIHMHTHKCICTLIHTGCPPCVCVCVRGYARTFLCMRACIRAHVQILIERGGRVDAYTHTCTNIQMLMHPHIYAHK